MRPIGRPHRLSDPMHQVCESDRLATVGGDDVELRLLLRLAFGDKRQARALR